MSGRTLCLAIGAVEIDRGWWVGSAPGSIVAGIDPEAAGIGVVIGEQLLRTEDVFVRY
jgi:hypothetical protein